MQLRSGTVTVAPVLPWPRPSDVTAKKYDDAASMAEYLVSFWFSATPTSITKRRLMILECAEILLANPQFRTRWPGLIETIARRFDEESGKIATFDAKEYTTRLRALVF